MVHCGPHEGRHTAELVADRIDQVIESLGIVGIMETQKGITTDNAPNMTNACKRARHIDSSHGCFDHQLNLIVTNGLKRVKPIMEAIQHFKRLATATHKSALFCGRIRQECNELERSTTKYDDNIKYAKMIQPQDTRWNSTLMCIKSIINLKVPLLELSKISGRSLTQDKTLENLQPLIPKRKHFDELEKIIPLLAWFEKISRQMESETVPTMCWVTFRAWLLRLKCDPKEETSAKIYPPGPGYANLRKLAGEFTTELVKRFPKDCTEIYEPSICGYLNPSVKDLCWKNHMNGKEMIDLMKRTEEGVPVARTVEVEEPIDMDDDEDDIITQKTKAMAPIFTAATASVGGFTPLDKECYLYASLPTVKTCFDVLNWWREHENQLPILASIVRKYMCIQASSSSSERTFSSSGNIVTPRRNKLDPENVNMLVYLKENLGKIEVAKLPPKPKAIEEGGGRVREDLDDVSMTSP